MKALWQKILNLVRKLLAKSGAYFVVTWQGKTDAVTPDNDLVNDPNLQWLALEAVKAAAALLLTGDEAWDKAYAQFKASVEELGMRLSRSVLDTILQEMYLWWKNHKKEG